MTTLRIIKDDKWASIDGVGMFLDAVVLPANVHAVQWDGTTGHIEYNDGTENETISSISAYSTITTDHATKVTEDNTAISNAATAQTTLEATYGWKREQEYPNIKDQLDDIYHNGVEGWKTTIKTTKDKYPK
tara:strand:- start:1510 stop:1905 length:396 start_codon:yes stop_codon:yes gene_type:complete